MRTQTEERGTITLNKPVLINGVQVTEMSYDTDEISGELYAQAEAHKMKASGSKVETLRELSSLTTPCIYTSASLLSLQ